MKRSRSERGRGKSSSREKSQRGPSLSLILYSIAAVIALGGLADATYLTISHLTGEALTCGTDCSGVLNSKYATVGPIPVALLGACGYFAAFSSATLAAFGYSKARTFLSIVVAGIFAGTLWFLYVQRFLLHKYCHYCLLSAALTFALAGLVVALPPAARASR